MNQPTIPQAPNSCIVSEFPRCQHRMRKGRCRELVSDPASGLCFKHAAQHKKDRDAANVAAKLIGDTERFTSAVVINYSLGELYKLLARDEISPRRGAVMAYTCNLLLRTLPAIDRELHGQGQNDSTILLDIPSAVSRRAAEAQHAQHPQAAERPEQAEDPKCALYKNPATRYGSYAIPVGSDPSCAPEKKPGNQPHPILFDLPRPNRD